MGAGGGGAEASRSLAGVWGDEVVRGDAVRVGIAGVIVAGVGTLITSPDPGDIGGEMVGALPALLTGLAAIVPGRRMPDWALGLEGGRPSTLFRAPLVVLGFVLAAMGWFLGTFGLSALDGLVALAVGVVAPLGVVWSLGRFLESARRMSAWADSQGHAWRAEYQPPEATPLLRAGDYRYAINEVEGELGGSEAGRLFHLGCVEIDSDSDGTTSQTTRRFTALLRTVPDVSSRLELCVCQPRSKIPGYDALEMKTKRLRRIDLESSDFEARFELAIPKEEDESWLRRLFEPTFTEALTLSDGTWGWELEGGKLLVYEAGWQDDAATLDRLARHAALVGARIADEAGESASIGAEWRPPVDGPVPEAAD